MGTGAIIESEAGFRHGKSLFDGREVTWYTTSPWLLDRLPEWGEEVRSLELDVKAEEAHAIGERAVLITERIVSFVDERITDLPSDIKAGMALAESLFRSIATLYYKADLLDNLVPRLREEMWVIGNPNWHRPGCFSALLSRKETLFAVLASGAQCQAFRVVPFEDPDWEKEARKKMARVGSSKWERLMNVINMRCSAFLFKAYRDFGRGRTRLAGGGRNSVFVFKQNPLIEEAFFPIRRRGMKVRILPSLELSESAGDESGALGTQDQFDAQCRSWLREMWKGQSPGPLMESATRVASAVVWEALKFARAQAKRVESYVKREIVGDGARGSGVVLTNGLSLPWEVMLYHGCRHEGIPVFLASHGVSAGLSRYHDRLRKIMSFSHGDVYFGYSRGECHTGGEHFVAGAPVSERTMARKRLQRHLARRRLRVRDGQRCVMYVANLYSNNSVDLPYGGTNDYFEHHLKHTVIRDVFTKLPDYCVAKLYPTQRYADPDPFLFGKHSDNIEVIQWSEFRYLRAACDVILVDMVQSAFGWAWSTGVPIILLDSPYYPLLPAVLKEMQDAIFVIPTEGDGWGEQLLDLLRLPPGEFLGMWRGKEPARRRIDQERIMGPKARGGTVIAQVISEKVKGRSHALRRE